MPELTHRVADQVAEVIRAVRAVRERAPLVHCITATASMGIVADGLLAAGARPMMTETDTEAPAMTRVADALLVNLGTLSSDGAQGIPPTVRESNARQHPWVLDAPAVGLAPVRTGIATQLLEHRPTVIRGNPSEVLALAGHGSGGRGADTIHGIAAAAPAAHALAGRTGAVISLSGATDLVTDGTRSIRVTNGHPLLARVTGTGCLLGALTAACATVTSAWSAAVTAVIWLSVAGESAASAATGPGSFRVALLDALDTLDGDELARRAVLS